MYFADFKRYFSGHERSLGTSTSSFSACYVPLRDGGDAPKLAKVLGTQGFSRVFVIDGGFAGWQKAGLAVTEQ